MQVNDANDIIYIYDITLNEFIPKFKWSSLNPYNFISDRISGKFGLEVVTGGRFNKDLSNAANWVKENVVSYADGFDPKTNENVWEDSHHVSGDDFAEFVPVSKEMLIALGRGIGKMKIKLTKSQIKVTVYK